jgi:ubiquinone/menaquinone biosynthesis C-methylase UbiE
MVKNRYDGLMRIHNQLIGSLGAPFKIFWHESAYIIRDKFPNEKIDVLEIGSGEGDSGLPILIHTKSNLHLLDVSKQMIETSKKILKIFKKRCEFYCEDVLIFLKKSKSYQVIYSSFTIHNFKDSDKFEVLKAIFDRLDKKGIFIWDDLISQPGTDAEMFKRQTRRYSYLPKNIKRDLLLHIKKDFSKPYVINEPQAVGILKKVGFKKIKIVDRLERELLIVAEK